jgi:hypothetical protein
VLRSLKSFSVGFGLLGRTLLRMPAKTPLTIEARLAAATTAATLSIDSAPMAKSAPKAKIAPKRGLKRKSSDASDGSGAREVEVLSNQHAVLGRCLAKPMLVPTLKYGTSVQCTCKASEQRQYAAISSRTEWLNKMISNIKRNDSHTASLSRFCAHINVLIDGLRILKPIKKVLDIVEVAVSGVSGDEEEAADEDTFNVHDLDSIVDDVAMRGPSKLKFPRKIAIEEIKLTVYDQEICLLNRKQPIYILLEVGNVQNLVRAIKSSMAVHRIAPAEESAIKPADESESAIKSSAPAEALSDASKPAGFYYNYLNRTYMIKYWSRDDEKYCWSSKGLMVGSDGCYISNKKLAEKTAKTLFNELDQSVMPRFTFEVEPAVR